MSFGLRLRNAAGKVRLEVTDRITRIVLSGAASCAYGVGVTISVPGMAADGEWFVVTSEACEFTINSGSFTLYSYYFSTVTVRYAVYRR